MARYLELETLDIEKFIKANKLKEVTNPIFFERPGVTSTDGLLSNEIFGITKNERSNIFAYIDLGKWFIDPLSYKMWGRVDIKVKECVRGVKNFIINSQGQLEENENGSCGIEFLRKNINNIKFKRNDSSRRDSKINFIEKNIKENKLFIRKYLVIPAYYRDVDTSRSEGKVSVGDINELYNKLLISVKSLKEADDYGIDVSNTTCGRIQDILVEIYNWFTKEPNLGQKRGIIKRTVMSKTADYASRLVISAPPLNVEKVNDLLVKTDTSAIPLSSLLANLFSFIVFWVRRFFENEFANGVIPVKKKDGTVEYIEVEDPLIQFSDDVIKKQINRFIKGYSNRFIPVEVKLSNGKTVKMKFAGYKTRKDDNKETVGEEKSGISNRNLTWCDLFFIAASEMSADKHAILTRYPVNDYFGQQYTKIAVSSTKETEPMYIDLYGNTKYYKYYPKIRQEDIGSNTSNKFVDTLRISNVRLSSLGGDYDGDQMTCKIAFTKESNEEIEKYMHSKRAYINMGGVNEMVNEAEALHSLYSLTLSVGEDESKMTNPVF